MKWIEAGTARQGKRGRVESRRDCGNHVWNTSIVRFPIRDVARRRTPMDMPFVSARSVSDT